MHEIPLPGESVLDFSRDAHESRPYRGNLIEVITDGGPIFLYRQGSEVILQVDDELELFARRRAEDVEPGDHILVLDPKLQDRLHAALARAQKAAALLQTYHAMIATARDGLPGRTLTDKARNLLRRLQLTDSSFTEADVHNVRRWLDVEPEARGGV